MPDVYETKDGRLRCIVCDRTLPCEHVRNVPELPTVVFIVRKEQ